MSFTQNKHREISPITIKKKLKRNKQKIDKKSKCIELQHINLNEKEIFTKDEQEELFKVYLGKCIDIHLLKQILHTTSQYYISNGYITTKPYLEEQNIQDGDLDITVIKGTVEKIINKDTNKSDGRIATAFAFQKGEVLNIRDLDTALEMINRVPSYHSKFQIIPGHKKGQSIIMIETKKETPYHLSLGVLGEKQDYDDNPYLNADFSLDNPFNINDILTVRINGSSIQQYYQSTTGAEIAYSFPIASYLISYRWFEFQYSQHVIGLNDSYLANGDTIGSNLKISKVLHRNQRNKVETAFSLEYKNNKNYFENQLIDVSSYKTTLAQLDLIYNHFDSWGESRTILSYYRGTNWLGARDDSYYINNTNDEKLQFNKFSLDENFVYNFTHSYQLISNLHLQYTKDLLYDNNKLRVGSYYTVRGYSSSYYGNNAYYIHNDLQKTFYPNQSQAYLQTISPFFGLDYGKVQCEKNTLYSCGSLAGYGVGIKTNAKNISSEFALSRAIKRKENQGFETLFRYSLTFKY